MPEVQQWNAHWPLTIFSFETLEIRFLDQLLALDLQELQNSKLIQKTKRGWLRYLMIGIGSVVESICGAAHERVTYMKNTIYGKIN